jgi:hypothetical protein
MILVETVLGIRGGGMGERSGRAGIQVLYI